MKRKLENRSRRVGPLSRELGYLQKWVPIAVLIGVVSGLGALFFYYAINLFTSVLLNHIAGYIPPAPAGEGIAIASGPSRLYLIPLVTTLGGLLSGIIVYGFAREAEGHGTDAALDAFHNKKGEIRSRVPIVKLVSSAVTIGSGGSAGREGPTAQISAGFGSFLGNVLHLNAHDRRIAVAVGIGAGIGSIFKAPFGGALLAAEIIYIRDFEYEALVPAFIASTIGYSIFGAIRGWNPIFGSTTQYIFHEPSSLILYTIIGVACGLVGIAYVRSFYGTRDAFKRFRVPNFIKPAIGGLAVGLIGMGIPKVLGMGYGWLQIAIDGGFASLSLGLILIFIVSKIFATSFSIGSGGSGGVFAPALVIGGMVGYAVWSIFGSILPGFQLSPAPFVIVGMMSFFGGVGKVPIAVILMVSEMTGTYTLLVPSMIATTIAYVITGKNTIYEKQVESRADSPAHRGEYSVPLLQRLTVKDAMSKKVITVTPDYRLSKVADTMAKNKIKGIPVVDRNKDLIGIITFTDILQVHPEQRAKRTAGAVMTKELITIDANENLYVAFGKMTSNQIGRLLVVDPTNCKKLIGIITREDISRVYDGEVRERLESLKDKK
jgi:CIC family chloride channel protein